MLSLSFCTQLENSVTYQTFCKFSGYKTVCDMYIFVEIQHTGQTWISSVTEIIMADSCFRDPQPAVLTEQDVLKYDVLQLLIP